MRNYQSNIYENPQEQLKNAKSELEELLKTANHLEKKAERHSNMMLFCGLTAAVGQLAGMGTLIFVIFDWNAIEPVTYLVCNYNLQPVPQPFYRVFLRHGWSCLLFVV